MTDQQGLAQKAEQGLSFQTISELTGFSLAQLAMIRHNMAASLRCKPQDVPLYDLALFTHACKELQLDPLLKQAYWISRSGKASLQVSIDGYRALAERTGTLAGSSPPTFRGQIKWTHREEEKVVPELCEVVVWKMVGGQRCPFTGQARWVEYVPRASGAGAESDMWAKMPFNQLAKCAEGQALRKAFPAQLGQVALDDEQVLRAQSQRTVEQVARPQRTTAENAQRYEEIYGHAHDWPAPQRPPAALEAPANVDPETGEVFDDDGDNSSPEAIELDSDYGEELARSRTLLGRARTIGVRGLGKYSPTPEWDLNMLLEANVALETLIAAKAGDDALAARQEATL